MASSPSGDLRRHRSASDYDPAGRGAEGTFRRRSWRINRSRSRGHHRSTRRRPTRSRTPRSQRPGPPRSATRWWRPRVLPQAVPRPPPTSTCRRASTTRLLDVIVPSRAQPGTRAAWTSRGGRHGAEAPTSASSRTSPACACGHETAQGIFLDFANVALTTSRRKPPFGIARQGKSFRKRSPGNFIFRTREFERMEIKIFVNPSEDEEWHQYWIDEARPLVRRPRREPEQPPPLRASPESSATTPSGPSTSSTATASTRRSSRSSRASPTAPTTTSPARRVLRRQGPVVLRPGRRQRYVPYVIDRRPPRPQPDGVPHRRLDEDEAPNTKAASTTAACYVSTRRSPR